MYETLDQVSIGSQFVRADLHIHSYGLSDGSYDVTDINMTPEAIVDISIQKNLKIISITDHNEINNSKKAIDYAKDKGILVIPGIEVSTTQGHLLLYFEDFSKLRNFHGKLDISEDKQRCSQGIVECLNLAEKYDGIGILAHIELTSGFEQTVSRFGPAMEDIVNHRNVWGLEISSKSSIDFYTERDQSPESAERKRLLNLRKQNLELGNDFEFAKLMSSDSHVLSKIGINAENNTRLTRIKVDSLNFQSFKVALINHQARIRLEDFIPERVPRFIGVILEGGLLSKQVIKFSPNLTCIIGGRGTGKSTLLESIIEASGNGSTAKVLDSDVWPEKISLFYEDEAGQNIMLVREKNSIVSNQTDSNGITKIYIESYGQGETADTIQHSDENPSALLKFLDSFTEVESLRLEDDEIRNILIRLGVS